MTITDFHGQPLVLGAKYVNPSGLWFVCAAIPADWGDLIGYYGPRVPGRYEPPTYGADVPGALSLRLCDVAERHEDGARLWFHRAHE